MRASAARVFLPAVAVLALVGIVAIAATGSTSAGSGDTWKPADVLLETIVGLSLVAMLGSVALLVYAFAHGRPREYPRTKGGLLATLAMLAALPVLLASLYDRARLLSLPRQVEQPPAMGALRNRAKSGAENADESHFSWLPVAVVLALAAIGVAAILLAERRRRARVEDPETVGETLADVLDDTIDDLRRETDPRRAVIAAYARLERALSAQGFPRRRAETQREYVARILDDLDVDRRRVRRLTDLFTRAKFSQHEVNVGMKEEAIDTLERVRDELREAEARRAELRVEAPRAGEEPA